MFFAENKPFLRTKIPMLYSRKINILPKRLTYDFGQETGKCIIAYKNTDLILSRNWYFSEGVLTHDFGRKLENFS